MNLIITNESAISKLYDFYCNNGLENEADEIIKKVLKFNYEWRSEYPYELFRDIIFNFAHSEVDKLKFNDETCYYEIFEGYIITQMEYLMQWSLKQMKAGVKEIIKNVLKEEFILINNKWEVIE